MFDIDGPLTVADLGGERAIYAEAGDLVRDSRVVDVAEALCGEWSTLTDPSAAASLLITAVDQVTPLYGFELFDILVTAEDALPVIAVPLEASLSRLARGSGMLRDMALEAWTRLAVGDWASKLNHLRAALEDGSTSEDPTTPLVRALGAALGAWPDASLRTALETLTRNEDLDADAAMELGLHDVAVATAKSTVDDVRAGLSGALDWFQRAYQEEGRSDAAAFSAVIRGVMTQTAGDTLSTDVYRSICDTVYEYLDGFIGGDVGWRGARPHAAGAWMELLGVLQQAKTDKWYNPPLTIQSLARTLAAHSTMMVVVNPGGTAGVRALVQPHVDALVGSSAGVADYVRRWLEMSGPTEDPALVHAVEDLLVHVEAPPALKGDRGSFTPGDAIRAQLNLTPELAEVVSDALDATPELRPVLERIAVYSTPPSYTEEKVLEKVLDQCDQHADGGIAAFRPELTIVLTNLIRFTAYHLNQGQNGERSAPWLTKKKNANGVEVWPLEHELADDLNQMLNMQRLKAYVEVVNTSGGRVDIAIVFERCTLYIEVKRTDENLSDEQLQKDFGTQAVQYAATDIPVAFLAVADYSRRRTRLDLPAVVQVRPHRESPTSRQHALVSVRLQANVSTPSATSASRI